MKMPNGTSPSGVRDGRAGISKRGCGMKRLLMVDDDDAVRRLIRLSLADCFEVIDTAEPEQAFTLALEHKPDAILLELGCRDIRLRVGVGLSGMDQLGQRF
jgi:CheY-like chemotaxis protein